MVRYRPCDSYVLSSGFVVPIVAAFRSFIEGRLGEEQVPPELQLWRSSAHALTVSAKDCSLVLLPPNTHEGVFNDPCIVADCSFPFFTFTFTHTHKPPLLTPFP
eukprot:220977-Pleurochrysis_carterae.AAC.2